MKGTDIDLYLLAEQLPEVFQKEELLLQGYFYVGYNYDINIHTD